MNIFTRLQHKKCGRGGIHCYCCNRYKGKDKPTLNRHARRALKKITEKEVEENS